MNNFWNKSEFENVRDFSRVLGLENKTDGSLFIYKTKENGIATKPDGYYYLDGVTFILDAKKGKEKFAGQLEDYMKLESNPNYIGFKYSGDKFECYVKGKKIYSELEPKNAHYYIDKYFKIKITNNTIVTNSAKKLAKLFRDSKIDKQMNVPFIGCVMICLKYGERIDDFSTTKNLIKQIKAGLISVINETVLERKQKKEFLINSLGDGTLQTAKITDLQSIISEIATIYTFINITDQKGHDTMNDFLKVFRKWNSVDAQEKGEVFTPDHIAQFMYKLIGCTYKDTILDPTCGSGTFLTNAMSNMLYETNNDEEKKLIKEERIIGIESNPFNATLAGINMMLHGDGASHIFQDDCFIQLPKQKGCYNKVLMNPPFSQNVPELKFIFETLNYEKENGLCAAIVPLSCAIGNQYLNEREQILEKHTLLQSIILPRDLFYPTNVATCILVFKAHIKHNSNSIVKQSDFSNDGFILRKHSGRIDKCNEEKNKNFWQEKPFNKNNVTFKTNWLLERKYDYSKLNEKDFIKTLIEKIKADLDLKLLTSDFENIESIPKLRQINTNEWKDFIIKDYFKVSKTIDDSKNENDGETPYVARKLDNNGIVGYKSSENTEHDCLTIHSEWSDTYICNYQDGIFCADGKIVKLESPMLNKYNGIFIATVMSKIFTWDYRLDTIKNTIIKLPSIKNGDLYFPDWEFMKKYIKNEN